MALSSAERQRRYAARHPERVRAAARRYAERNREVVLAKKRAYAAANRKPYTWHKDNPEKAKAASRQWREANREKYNALHKAWRDANKDKIRVWRRQQRALKRGAAVALNDYERAEVFAIYAKARALTELIGEPYHVDHIVPLSKGGKHHPSNLQVLRGVDNLKKGAKL